MVLITVTVKPIVIAVPDNLYDYEIDTYLDDLKTTPVITEWADWKRV